MFIYEHLCLGCNYYDSDANICYRDLDLFMKEQDCIVDYEKYEIYKKGLVENANCYEGYGE